MGRSRIALSIPWTGYGVCTSNFVYPASRVASAACRIASGVSNSAVIAYRGLCRVVVMSINDGAAGLPRPPP